MDSLGLSANYGRAALVIAKPSDELFVHGWLEVARPLVFVLTDGSGTSSGSRLASTRQVIERTGAKVGEIFGRCTDQQVHRTVLAGDFSFYRAIVADLAAALVRQRIDFVLGEAADGVSLSRDLWRGIVNSAVILAERLRLSSITNYEFSLSGPDNFATGSEELPAISIRLDDNALQRKITAARAYLEIATDAEQLIQGQGSEAFRVECLRLASASLPSISGDHQPESVQRPPYEMHGEKLVAAGRFERVIRFQQHVAPILRSLGDLQRTA